MSSSDKHLQANLTSLSERITAAARRAGRPTESVTLVAVSKTFPAEAVLALARCGQRHFGENYLQEALAKIEAVRAAAPGLPLVWHFVGPIQSNKTRPIAEHFDWVQSVERLKIAQRLSEQRPAHLPPLNVLLQVNISGEASKSGVAPGELPALARAVAALPRLRLRGLMAVPEPTDDPQRQRAPLAAMKALFDEQRAAGFADWDTLSMGMSADLEAAIGQGATMVRVGTALFGERVR
ncbi:MAG: YggS family pyridoxal phosphate-dependent enzyme [Burkholderiales bacterium]|nr:MAG: YggS family pyridoxal phosphate-dependent enzyme [Burkholderiales bacterium]